MRTIIKWSIVALGLLVICLLALNYFNFIQLYKILPFLPHRVEPIVEIQKPPVWESGAKLIEEKKIPEREKILEINLSYDAGANPAIRIVSLNVKNGSSPRYLPVYKGYELQIVDRENKLVYSLAFKVPNTIIIETFVPLAEGEQEELINPGDSVLKKMNFTLTIPYTPTGKTIRILDPGKKIIASRDLSNVPIINNKPNFDSIPGANALGTSGKQGNLLEFIFPKALARIFDGMMHIAFIGDRYKDMDQFRQDVDRFINTFLTYEPFKTRASQIVFERVDNTVDLGCSVKPSEGCNISLPIQLLNDAAVTYDIIYVIVNTNEQGGYAWKTINFAVGPRGGFNLIYGIISGPNTFVHEMGHVVGDLEDEYIRYKKDGVIANYVVQNCYLGTPTTEVWPDVPLSDYRKGCTYENWYRSSENSIMRKGKQYFNIVSQRLLNEGMDSIIGLPPTPTPTTGPDPLNCQEARCGNFASGGNCWCDAACVGSGDCCPDACAICGQCIIGPDPEPPPPCSDYTNCDSCVSGAPFNCGWKDDPAASGSFCESGTSSCPAITNWYWFDCITNQCILPAPTTGPDPLNCQEAGCGNFASGGNCWCDAACVGSGDCCPDACAICGQCIIGPAPEPPPPCSDYTSCGSCVSGAPFNCGWKDDPATIGSFCESGTSSCPAITNWYWFDCITNQCILPTSTPGPTPTLIPTRAPTPTPTPIVTLFPTPTLALSPTSTPMPTPTPILAFWGESPCVKDGVATLDCIPPVIKLLIQSLLIFAGIVAIFLIIQSGAKFVLSSGDPKKVEEARNTLVYVLLGIIIIAAAFLIVRLVSFVTGVDCLNFIGFVCL